MKKETFGKLLVGAALLSIAACSGGGDGGGGNGNQGSNTIQDKFGSTFANAFNANANAEPIDPKPGDLPAVSLTTDPIDF